MGVTLSQIANNVAHVAFSYGGETVNVVYYPSRVTERTFAALDAFANLDSSNIGAGFQSLNELLAQLIKSWDVFEDDAQTQMYPLTPDRLAALPVAFRVQVVGAVLGDIRPEAVMAQPAS